MFATVAAAVAVASATPAIAARPVSHRFDTVDAAELKGFVTAHGPLEVPFKSAFGLITACLASAGNDGSGCVGAVGLEQNCETSAPQCASAAADAWQVYVDHYLRILQTTRAGAGLAATQKAWEAYRDAECGFEEDLFDPTEGSMRAAVATSCRHGKTAERAVELRDALVNLEID